MCDNLTPLHALPTNETIQMQPNEWGRICNVKFKRLLREGSGDHILLIRKRLVSVSLCKVALDLQVVGVIRYQGL